MWSTGSYGKYEKDLKRTPDVAANKSLVILFDIFSKLQQSQMLPESFFFK